MCSHRKQHLQKRPRVHHLRSKILNTTARITITKRRMERPKTIPVTTMRPRMTEIARRVHSAAKTTESPLRTQTAHARGSVSRIDKKSASHNQASPKIAIKKCDKLQLKAIQMWDITKQKKSSTFNRVQKTMST